MEPRCPEQAGDSLAPLTYPPNEQKVIASFLDRETAKIDALAEQEQLIELLKENRQAVISHAVTRPELECTDEGLGRGVVGRCAKWDVSALDALSELQKVKWIREDPYRSMTLIAPNHIEQRSGRLFQLKQQKNKVPSGKYICEKGDVIYSKIRPALRKACVAPDNCLTSADMYPLESTSRLASEFIVYYLLSEQFSSLAVLESERVAMPKINRDTLGSIPIVIPPMSEQKEIIRHIETQSLRIDALSNEASACIALMQERRSALISAAVTGQIDVRGLVPEEEVAA